MVSFNYRQFIYNQDVVTDASVFQPSSDNKKTKQKSF